MKFFRLDTSLRTEGSVTRRLADAVEQQWLQAHPGSSVIRRDLGQHPLPQVWQAAVSAAFAGPDDARSPEQLEAVALAAELVDELLAADAFVFGVPIYNWGVPQQLKQWIDLVISDPRASAAAGPFLAGRPAVLVEARGGGYAPGTPREGWDYATPYVARVLGDLWGLDVSVARAELTLADVNPAMADLREIAARQLVDAEASASAHAAAIARSLRATA
jgi:FMN-dependent NADH-azoreductase